MIIWIFGLLTLMMSAWSFNEAGGITGEIEQVVFIKLIYLTTD